MITISQENKVREMLTLGISEKQIHEKTNVSRKAVSWIRKATEIINGMSENEVNEVRKLLIWGLPVSAIEIRTHITRNKIIAIRRHYFLHKRRYEKDKPRKCPTCGSIMFPQNHECDSGNKSALRLDCNGLYRVASDVIELNNLQIITNPLFYYLAKRAEKELEKVNAENKSSN